MLRDSLRMSRVCAGHRTPVRSSARPPLDALATKIGERCGTKHDIERHQSSRVRWDTREYDNFLMVSPWPHTFRPVPPVYSSENRLGRHPHVLVIQTADASQLNHPPPLWRLPGSSDWSVPKQGEMRSRPVVVPLVV